MGISAARSLPLTLLASFSASSFNQFDCTVSRFSTMSSSIQCHPMLAIALVLLLAICESAAFMFSKKTQGRSSSNKQLPSWPDDGVAQLTYAAASPPISLNHEDFTALIRPMTENNSGIYTHALQILSSLQTSPSCIRSATSTLLESCHSIDGSKTDVESQIEDVRSIYAAQLAMCEITSAGSSVPQSCKALAPLRDATPHRNGGSLRLRKTQLGDCLQTLESRPQWWTSYSNSRQNAVVMCQAARFDIDKGNR